LIVIITVGGVFSCSFRGVRSASLRLRGGVEAEVEVVLMEEMLLLVLRRWGELAVGLG
jgi:hypothetical protein